jgi:LacI family repressor for deo operon, udp, cdd, tsx, nupC, and nupG
MSVLRPASGTEPARPTNQWPTVTRIYDVATAAGVSTATVSRALRGLPHVSAETRNTIKRIADDLGYVPSSNASGLARGRTDAFGVLVPSFTEWFGATVLEGVDRELRNANFDLVIYEIGTSAVQRKRVFNRSLLRKRTDALLALSIDFTPQEREKLASDDLPAVVIGGRVRGVRSIGIDEQATARQATKHLLSLGHHDIVHLNGNPETQLNPLVSSGRRKGYEEALSAAGVAIDPRRQVFGDFSLMASRTAMNSVLADGSRRPTAVFASSDEMAIGAILAAWDQGLRVPDDLSVIGIDGHPLGVSFGLTTIAQDPAGQGALAVSTLLAELGGHGRRQRFPRAPTTFISRSTTGPPPAAR